MISEETTKLELIISGGLDLAEINLINLQVVSAESRLVFGCGRGRHGCESGLHEHRWLYHLRLAGLEVSSKFCRSFEHGENVILSYSVV